MPSVRVKRGDYATLKEQQEARTLATIFRGQDDEHLPVPPAIYGTSAQQPQSAPPTMGRSAPTAGSSAAPHGHNRLRRGRVHNHCMRTSVSGYPEPPFTAQPRRVSISSQRDTSDARSFNGSSVIEVRTGDRQPGLIDSALSLDSQDMDNSMTAEQRDQHHDDDIVEHLDVIGAFNLIVWHRSGTKFPHLLQTLKCLLCLI